MRPLLPLSSPERTVARPFTSRPARAAALIAALAALPGTGGATRLGGLEALPTQAGADDRIATEAAGLNDEGLVAVNLRHAGAGRSASEVWRCAAGQPCTRLLDSATGPWTAVGVGRGGAIVGDRIDSSGSIAVIVPAGAMAARPLPPPRRTAAPADADGASPAAATNAHAIDDAGLVLTSVAGEDGARDAYLDTAARRHALHSLGGPTTFPMALSSSGRRAVGWSLLPDGYTQRAFLVTADRSVDLGTLGGEGSIALAVTAEGLVGGCADLVGNAERHAFIGTARGLRDLGTLGGAGSCVHGLNARGEAVGWSQTAEGASRAFLWRANRMQDLNDLLPDSERSQWVLLSARAINGRGQIVGTGRYRGAMRAFRATLVD